MQTPAKQKGLILALGILIGMLVAFGIVWLDFERLSHKVSQQISNLLPKKGTEKSKTDTIVIVEKMQPATDTETDTDTYIDTLPYAPDSLPIDSLSLLVKKDELLHTKTIKLIRLTPPGGNAIDTAMAQAADIEPANLPGSYTVEFWKSPINYRGYKLGRNKIVLFGIYQADDISLVSVGSSVFLKNRDVYFRLEPGEEYASLSPVADKNLLVLLNQ